MKIQDRKAVKAGRAWMVQGTGWVSQLFATEEEAQAFCPDPEEAEVVALPHPRGGTSWVVKGKGWRSQRFNYEDQARAWLLDRPELNVVNLGDTEPPDSVDFEETSDSEAEEMVERVAESIQRSVK